MLKKIIPFILIFLLLFIFFIQHVILKKKIYNAVLHQNIIEIKYNDKKEVSIKLKNSNFYIPMGYGHYFKVGDSIFKEKNSFLIKQYRSDFFLDEFVWGEEED
jgi:hypothetical protein